MTGEPLGYAYLGSDGGYRDRISAPPEGSGIPLPLGPMGTHVVQPRQALGAYSVPGELRLDHSICDRNIVIYRERALAAEAECRQLRAALSEALAAAGV